MGTNYGPKVVTDGLIFYLDGFPPSVPEDGEWIDLIYSDEGEASKGGPYNPSGWYEFDASENQYISFGDLTRLNFALGSFSLEILLRCSDVSNNQGIITKDYETNWGLFHVASNWIGLYITSGANNVHVTMDDYYDDWVYLSFTSDNPNNIQKSYANGVFDNQTNHTVGSMGTWDDLNIGRYTSSGTGYFTGDIANIKIYNKVLTDDEVMQNYTAIKGRFI